MFSLQRSSYMLLLLTTFFNYTANAQIKKSNYEISIAAGCSDYMGDLTPTILGAFKKLKPAISVAGMKLMSPYIALRAQILKTQLNGNDAWYNTPAYRQLRSFNFSTQVTELSLVGIYNIAGTNFDVTYQPLITPFISAGVAISSTRIRRDWSAVNAAFFTLKSNNQQLLAMDIATTPPRWILSIPIGGGIRTPLNERWNLVVESQYRLLFTDYLDGFSNAANPKEKDGFITAQLGLIYKCGRSGSVKCPKKP